MEPKMVVIDKLEGESNWSDWKFQVKIQLQALGLMPAVTGTLEAPRTPEKTNDATLMSGYKLKLEAYNKAEYTAQNIIVTSVTSKVRQLINMTTTAQEMWEKLNGIFEQRTEQRQDRLFNLFFGIKEKDQYENIASHIARLEKLWTELIDETWKEDKVKLPESLFMNRILNTLPPEYMEFTNAWESVPKKERTVRTLTQRLCTVEQRLLERNGCSSMQGLVETQKKDKTRNHSKPNKHPDKKIPSKKNITCFLCNLNGHYKSQCPQKGNQSKKSGGGSGGSTSAYVGMLEYKVDDPEGWVADSGATQHITNKREWFATWDPFVVPRDVFVGNGQVMKALGQGNINAKFYVNKKWIYGFLEKVWYVPEAGRNLYSVLSSLDKGMTASMDRRTCRLERDRELKAVAERRGGLYYMSMQVVIPQVTALVQDSDTLQLWHERLSHQNKRYIKSYLKSQGVTVKGDEKEICEACVFGKHHRLSFHLRRDQHRGSQPGDRIHSDVCGPMPVKSLGGARYFVCFKDDFSKFREVYFLKEKSEVSGKLKDFLNKANIVGHRVKEILTDGGREFVCSEVKKLASASGWDHRVVMPYCPEQNGAAERENRTLVEAARTMLQAKNLPEFLWAEAVNTASYILNRSGPTSVAGKTPIELWTGKGEKLDHLKVFGTVCYIHVPGKHRKKWDRKAMKGHLVGYCGHDGYRVWVPEKRDVLTSKHVTFKPETTIETIKSNLVESQQVWIDLNSNCQSEVSEARGREVTEITSDSLPSTPCVEKGEREDSNSIGNRASQASPPRLRNRENLKKPDFYGVSANIAELDPLTVKEALSSPDASKWKAAMDDEMLSLVENKTWELVDLPPERKAIFNKWVLRRKPNPDGTPGRYKARLVACGYSQKEGIDYDETYSPVARFDTIRTVLAVAAKENLYLRQFDVKTAFLYGYLDEEIYMKQPKGYEDGTTRVCRLVRSLYGLKQAPRCWNHRLTAHLKKIGLKPSTADPCLFTRKGGKKLIICLYVDDGLVAGSDKETVDEFLSVLEKEFKITSGPLDQYLGVCIKEDVKGISLSQTVYINKMLEKFKIGEVHPKATPMEAGFVTSESEEKPVDSRVPYREAIGSLMYLSVATRPDIAFAVNCLAQATEKPQEKHWKAVKRIFRYLKGTSGIRLVYSRTGGPLEAYCDADYASDPKSRKSVSGVVCCYAGGAITWFSRKQRCTATSSTEAEYISGSEAAKEIVWLRQILEEVSSQQEECPTLWVDNLGAVKLAKNPSFHRLSKHIDVRCHYIREKFEEGVFTLEHISGEEQLADILTKPLPTMRFVKLRQPLGLKDGSKFKGEC